MKRRANAAKGMRDIRSYVTMAIQIVHFGKVTMFWKLKFLKLLPYPKVEAQQGQGFSQQCDDLSLDFRCKSPQ